MWLSAASLSLRVLQVGLERRVADLARVELLVGLMTQHVELLVAATVLLREQRRWHLVFRVGIGAQKLQLCLLLPLVGHRLLPVGGDRSPILGRRPAGCALLRVQSDLDVHRLVSRPIREGCVVSASTRLLLLAAAIRLGELLSPARRRLLLRLASADALVRLAQ